jgi:DNA-binding transcriptional ArsR family regulator
MGYSELIKDFTRIRSYLRSFYVYGFRHRDEFTLKSARSYDNERRRVESWLGDYMSFGQDSDGRRVFLSVDSRASAENPLYRAFRTKTFTDRDITLHYHILDILKVRGGLSVTGVMDELSDRLLEFENYEMPDESTVRKKLREYASLGLLTVEKQGRERVYSLSEDKVCLSSWDEAAAFFSEAAPAGVIGSFIQDRLPEKFRHFRYKHHYILNALDSEVLCELFSAMGERRTVTLTVRGKNAAVLPMKIYIGTQTGREYLLAMSVESGRFSFIRIDLIDRVRAGTVFEYPEGLQERMQEFCSHIWGVAGNNVRRLEHLEMTLSVGEDERYIVERLVREKRCGVVMQVSEGRWRFSADVYDPLELVPWLRTFTGNVTDLKCTDESVPARFWNDLEEMMQIYGGGGHAVS